MIDLNKILVCPICHAPTQPYNSHDGIIHVECKQKCGFEFHFKNWDDQRTYEEQLKRTIHAC